MSSQRWLIVGLGNPGKEYEKTRHNAGFMAIEAFARRWNIAGKGNVKFNAIVGTGNLALSHGHSVPVVIAQPTTYMNLSGEAVSRLMHFYNIEPSHLLVVFDDVALPVGKIRIRPEGSAGGQKGMKSIIQHLGKNDVFCRIRIGIGQPEGRKGMVHHVLEQFNPEEASILEEVIEMTVEAVEKILVHGVDEAMNTYNGKDLAGPPPPGGV